MKRMLLCFTATACLLLCSLAVHAEEISAASLSSIIQAEIPVKFGYVDNTEYCMQYELKGLSGIDDSHIVVCADATNFNEIGVFHVESAANAKRCAKQLSEYLKQRNTRFQNGVIYDINEYPKFENAKVTVLGSYIIYTILTPTHTTQALRAAEAALK